MALVGSTEVLQGDAAIAASRWQGATEALSISIVDDAELVVDALFGAGLSRALDGGVRELVEEINHRHITCIAVIV